MSWSLCQFYTKKHFYVVCFNIKHSRVDVLDNSAREDDLNIEKKYEGWVEKLQDVFTNYLRIQKHQKAQIMKNAPIIRQKMDWRTQENVIDCGIFAMRHMETYMGEMTGWQCGLTNETVPNALQQRQLNDLRIKYIAKLLLHYKNEHRKKVVKSLKKFLELGPAKINELNEKRLRRIQQRMAQYID